MSGFLEVAQRGRFAAAARERDRFPGVEATATNFDATAWLLCPACSYLPLETRVTIDFLREEFSQGKPPPVDRATSR